MASLMWNHAPTMWDAMEKSGITKSSLTPQAAADLFAWFVSARYFEKPGDAARGKAAFSARHCAACHGITDSLFPGAPPVATWASLSDPIILAQRMWNHGAKMREEFRKKKLAWPQLTGQELTDILVYLQNLPQARNLGTTFTLTPAASNPALFAEKGCAACHKGPKMSLERLLHNQTLTDIAADMWNHQPQMKSPAPELSPDEMRQIIGYAWEQQYFRGAGSPLRGRAVFARKGCEMCHRAGAASEAPPLGKSQGPYSNITMVAALWNHGPVMLESMKQKGIHWPRFTAAEMTDLIAYLNSL
jgi:cytochrome c551/c552